jgi:hypothetical protein
MKVSRWPKGSALGALMVSLISPFSVQLAPVEALPSHPLAAAMFAQAKVSTSTKSNSTFSFSTFFLTIESSFPVSSGGGHVGRSSSCQEPDYVSSPGLL